MNIVIANYGNESLALIQWAYEQQLPQLLVLSVATGWQASQWQSHLEDVFQFLENKGIAFKHVQARQTMAELVLDRGSFPTKKFQWCAPLLKGVILNAYLDEIDPTCEAKLYFGKRKEASRANQYLISGEESEHYNLRRLYYPLLDYTLDERDQLLIRAGFRPLSQPSHECFPCIHTQTQHLNAISATDLKKVQALENQLNTSMFSAPIAVLRESAQHASTITSKASELYDMGCGSIWGCGE